MSGEIPKDINEIVSAAEQGYAPAQMSLGLMYENGKGVPQDYGASAKWYNLAAEQGNADAQYHLGGLYVKGQGVPQDNEAAFKWYSLAAEQGNADAQLFLGVSYQNGEGVPQDYTYAHMWWNIAACQGHTVAEMVRDNIEKKMSPTQIETAQRLAREFEVKPMTDLYRLPTRANPEQRPPDEPGTGERSIGWAKGEISDGRPYWAECWAQDGVTMVTIFLSSKDLRFGEDHSMQDELPVEVDSADKVIVGDEKVAQDFLEKEGLMKFKDKSFVSPCRYSDDNGDFWSINIVVGNEDEVYCDSQISFLPYGNADLKPG